MLPSALASLEQMYDGFHAGNNVVLEDLQKALSAGTGTDAASFTGGRALQPESLDKTLVNVLHSQDEAKLFKALKKYPVASTVHQYTKRSEVGARGGAWVGEGGDSQETNQTLARKTISMKYLQTLRKVTLQMASVESIEDAEALEAEAGTLWLVREVERALFEGDSTVVAEEPDGLRKLITDYSSGARVLDMRGAAANSSAFEDLMIKGPRLIRESYGKADTMFAAPRVYEDVQKLLRDRIRVPAGGGDGAPGAYKFSNYPTMFGDLALHDNVFIQPGDLPAASGISGAPTAPTFTVAKANSSSQFTAADAGAYIYILAGVNKFGEGAASAAVTMAGVVANDVVTLTITVQAPNATGYHLYRTAAGGAAGTAKFVKRIGGTPATIVDSNADLPGCSDVYILTMSPTYNSIEWNQFLPMMKFPLYPTNAAVYPFLMLIFGALNLKKEEQMIRIKNVGYSA